ADLEIMTLDKGAVAQGCDWGRHGRASRSLQHPPAPCVELRVKPAGDCSYQRMQNNRDRGKSQVGERGGAQDHCGTRWNRISGEELRKRARVTHDHEGVQEDDARACELQVSARESPPGKA